MAAVIEQQKVVMFFQTRPIPIDLLETFCIFLMAFTEYILKILSQNFIITSLSERRERKIGNKIMFNVVTLIPLNSF